MTDLPDPVITAADLEAQLHTALNAYPSGAPARYPYTNTNWIGGGAMWSDNPDNENAPSYIRAPGDVDLNDMAAGIGCVGIHDWFELSIEEGVDYTASNTVVEIRRMGLACHRLDGSWDVVTPSEDVPGPLGVLSNAQHGHYDEVLSDDGHLLIGCASSPTDAGSSYHFGALFSVTDGSVPGDISPADEAPLRAHTSSTTSYDAGIDYLASVDPDTIDGVAMWIEARVVKADPEGDDTPLDGIYRLLPGFDLIPTGRKISEGGPGDGWPGFWGWTLALTGDWQTGVVWTGLPEGATIVDDPPIPGYSAEGGGGGGEPGVNELGVRFVLDPDGNPLTYARLISDTTGLDSAETTAYFLALPTATSVAIGDGWAVIDINNYDSNLSVRETWTWGTPLGTTSSVLGALTSGVEVGPYSVGPGISVGLFMGVATGPAATGVSMEYRSTSGAHGTVTATTSIDVTGGGGGPAVALSAEFTEPTVRVGEAWDLVLGVEVGDADITIDGTDSLSTDLLGDPVSFAYQINGGSIIDADPSTALAIIVGSFLPASTTLDGTISGIAVAPGTATFLWTYVVDGDTYTATASIEVLPAAVDSPQYMVEFGIKQASDAGVFTLGRSELGGPDVLGGQLFYEWIDVTPWVVPETVRCNGGGSGTPPWADVQVGSCSFTIDDRDQGFRWDPRNLTGPYVRDGATLLGPGMAVRINVLTSDGRAESQFRGWVDTYDPSYGTLGNRVVIEVTGNDAPERLNAASLGALPVAQGAGDTLGERAHRILDRIGWPKRDRDIDMSTQSNRLQATTMAQSAWDDLKLAADSDAALVWVARDGRITVRRRSSMPNGPQVTFSMVPDVVPGLEFVEPKLTNDRRQIINVAALTREGGVEQTSANEPSIADFRNGKRGVSRTGLICTTDAEVKAIADWIVSRYGPLRLRVEQFTVELRGLLDDEDTWRRVVRLDQGDRVRVVLPIAEGMVLDQQAVIRGRSLQVVGAPEGRPSIDMTFSLEFAPGVRGTPFILGQSLLGGPDQLTTRF